MMDPLDVIRVLNRARVRFVLTGSYGLAHWNLQFYTGRVVELIVARKDLKLAEKVLDEAYPNPRSVNCPLLVRLEDRETWNVGVVLVKPYMQPYLEALRRTSPLSTSGQRYRIPSLEMAIVMTFSTMFSMYRAEADRIRDEQDFSQIVRNNPDFDAEKLVKIGSLLFRQAGKYVLGMARQALAGERLTI